MVVTALFIAMTFAAGARAAAPSAALDGPSTAVTGAPIGFDAAGSAGADGGELVYAWVIDGQALDIDDAWLSVSFSHAGRHVVSVVVTDANGASARADHVVLVAGADQPAGAVGSLGSTVIPGASPFPQLVLRAPATPISHSTLRLQLRCRHAAVCRGHLRAVALIGPGPVERPLLLTRRRFSILRGGPRLVHLRLGPRARRRLAAHPRIRVTAYRGAVRVAHIWATSAYRVRTS